MQYDQWALAWQHPLVYGCADESRLPATSREFLVHFGLPRIAIFECRNAFEISFLPLEKPLVSYKSLIGWDQTFSESLNPKSDNRAAGRPYYSESLDREWSHQQVVGKEEFCNGHAAHCIHEHTGIVSRLDSQLLGYESHPAQLFVNSSVELFAASLLAAQTWSVTVHSDNGQPSVASLGALVNELKSIDPRAFEDTRFFWPNLIEVVLENPDNDPLELEITSDPNRSKPRF